MNSESLIHFPLFVVRWKGQGLIIYLIMLAVIGLPALIMEILVGNLFLPKSWLATVLIFT